MTGPFSRALAVLPTAALTVIFAALAWHERGSILGEDWLPYALAATFLAATLIASGFALVPPRTQLIGVAALVGLAVWTALSALWSPVPSLAREEALLVLFYAFALGVPLLTLRSSRERLAGLAVVVAAAVALMVATCIQLWTADEPAELYSATRLGSPIRYPGATAALLLVSFWPAVALAADRRLNVALRTLAFGGAAALLAGWLMTQSRAAAVALAVSAIVVLALTPARLRLLVPAALVSALAGAAYEPLTDPFMKDGAVLDEAITTAAKWGLAVPAAAAGIGLIYALADRRLSLPPRFTRAAGYAVLVVAACAALAGLVGFAATVDAPTDYVERRWEEFKRQPETETGSSHLVSFGSNRYDFWRVALDDFRDHPLAGAGGRAFGPTYLREGDTGETPLRSHSLAFDVLGETGLVGAGLLAAALLPFLWTVARRARTDVLAAGVAGSAACWLAHAAGDWTWTFPAVGLPFMLLLATGATGGEERRLDSRAGVLVGAALAVAGLVAFAPPWLSSRYTARALEQTHAQAEDDLSWARRLDPLSVGPLIAEAELAPSPRQAIPPLERAVEREPESVGPRYVLALAYLDAGRRADARRELRTALRLAPRSDRVREALRRARPRRTAG